MNDENFKITKLADFGSSEPWVARIWMAMKEYIDRLLIPSDVKKNVHESYIDLFDSLSLTFISLRTIETMINDKNTPSLTLTKEYHNFYNNVWTTLKDRFQKCITELNMDIGFIFQEDSKFDIGLNKFTEKYSINDSDKNEIIRDRVWINKLSILRNNYLQHKKISKEIENDFFDIETAKTYFHNTWTFIEDLSLIAMEQHLPKFAKFQEIPEADRDPAVPKRFQIVLNPDFQKNEENK